MTLYYFPIIFISLAMRWTLFEVLTCFVMGVHYIVMAVQVVREAYAKQAARSAKRYRRSR